MAHREDPYGRFNFIVSIEGVGDDVGGFSEVSGVSSEVVYAEYRNGNDGNNDVRKIPTLTRTGDVTLRRGLIGDPLLFTWLKATREGDTSPKTVTITLLDEARQPVCSWVLHRAQPRKWTSPTLSATGTDVAVEELVLVCERLDFTSS